ncbi:phosphatidylinositol 3 and 4-kinase-domain-containing protein [Schizophyllum fasciatum]
MLMYVPRWTESIAQKVKRKKKASGVQRRKIWRSVFEPYVPPAFEEIGPVKTLDHEPPMTRAQFDAMVQAIKDAIAEGIHPKMIAKGSSGSYFARAKDETGRVRTVAVFKPKDEEPYGRLNPKTTNYISEAAASLLDSRLKLNIVPPTQLVALSSPAFYYDWIDRNAYKKGKMLPDKIGSMQIFMNDATDFLRKHPWPGRTISDTFDDSTHRRSHTMKRILGAVKIVCGRTGSEQDVADEDDDDQLLYDSAYETADRPFYWSQALQQSFRAELEKNDATLLTRSDYLMQNTDRGSDNYMIKYCDGVHEKPSADTQSPRSSRTMPQMTEVHAQPTATPRMEATASRVNTPGPSHSSDYTRRPHIHIAAIDNSLSFPHEHPQGWRSYTYGWLYLPVSIIGKPFSEEARNHFLPLLTSKTWWEETTYELEKLFSVDEGFHPKMFARQLAVIKGQAYNIVQSLKHADEGPLELTRRKKVMVWDDEIEVPELELDQPAEEASEAQGLPSPHMSVYSVPLPRRSLSISSADFPPPMTRTSTDASGAPRPVSFASKIQRVHPGTTGVTMLEHLERLDAVEASLQRLGVDEDTILEEDDVGDRPPTQPQVLAAQATLAVPTPRAPVSASLPVTPFSPPSSPPMPTLHEAEAERSATPEESDDEADVVAMSKSMSHAEGSPLHSRWSSHQAGTSRAAMEWAEAEADGESPLKTVINERLEVIEKKPLLSCW